MLRKILDYLFPPPPAPEEPESDVVPNYDARAKISEELTGHVGLDRAARKLRERSAENQHRTPHFTFPTASKD